MITLLLPLFLGFYIISCHAYLPLGTAPPLVCNVGEYECPSHYLCIQSSKHDEKKGHCICHGFFGFYGPQCRDLSLPSYMLVIFSVFNIVAAFMAISYNIALIYICQSKNKLKPLLFQALSMNVIALFPSVIMNIGFIISVFESLDPNMYFFQYLRGIVLAVLFSLTMLTSLGISIYWIELIEKVKGNNKNYHFKYKCFLYGISIFWVFLTLLSHFIFGSIGIVGFLGTILVGYSYYYGGTMVVQTLRRQQSLSSSSSLAEEVIPSPSEYVLELATAVEMTSTAMTKTMFLLSISFIFFACTMPTGVPIYSQQNNLPRWCQGQIAIFLVFVLLPVSLMFQFL